MVKLGGVGGGVGLWSVLGVPLVCYNKVVQCFMNTTHSITYVFINYYRTSKHALCDDYQGTPLHALCDNLLGETHTHFVLPLTREHPSTLREPNYKGTPLHALWVNLLFIRAWATVMKGGRESRPQAKPGRVWHDWFNGHGTHDPVFPSLWFFQIYF